MAAVAETERLETLRPVLKWAGGKRWLLPRLRQLWIDSGAPRLAEPFCGGLSVAIGLMPSQALLNDINPHVINLFRWLKKGLRIDFEMSNDSRTYYTARDQFNALVTRRRDRTAKAAGLFYYLNRTGYNGLCRFNSQGRFNVPFGRYGRINYFNDFSTYRDLFADWEFSATDFARVEVAIDDFIYADPPYDVEFTQYSREAFTWKDQIRLAEWLMRHPGPVVLSNQATRRIVQLYEECEFKLSYVTAPRRISCTGDRSPATEVLATRNL
jgi:DNA adenine methylase